MDAVPIIDAFLSEKIGATEMLRLIIAHQTMKEESEGIFRFFYSIIEPSSEDGILHSTEFPSLALN